MSQRGLGYACTMVILVAALASTSLRAQTGVPGIPTNLQVSAAGNRVTATWAAPLTGGGSVGYVVIARNAAGATVVEQPVGGATTASGDVPAGVYFVSVRGENTAGAGPETAPRTVSVAIAGVPGMPIGLSVAGLGNVLSISWNAPASGGAPANYVVTMTDNASGEVIRFGAGTSTSLTLGRRDGAYSIVVQATNREGAGPESLSISANVPLAGPPPPGAPGMPSGFDVAVGGNVLSLSWAPPTTGGPPTRYFVLQRNAAGAVGNVFDMGNILSYAGSVPSGVYAVSVVAANSAGGGPATAVQTATAPSGTNLPGRPSLVATVSGNTVRFSWTPGSGAAASQYTLRAAAVLGGSVIATLGTTGQTTQLDIDAVPPGTYFATVVGSNSAGEGLPSNTVTVVVAGAAVTRSTLNSGLTTGRDFRFSQTFGNGQLFSKVFDDFVLGPGARIKTIAWQGGYCTQVNNGPVPAPSASGFTISLHADNNGRPNTTQAIASATVSMAQANQTFAGSTSGSACGNASNTGVAYYNYSLTLPTAVPIEGGTRYWLAIQAINSANSAAWGWRTGTVDTRSTYQLSSNGLTLFESDRAFALEP